MLLRVCILPDTLAIKEDGPFEVYEHFNGDVKLLSSEPRARVGTNAAPCHPPDFCVQTFSSKSWIHISGSLTEKNAFAVIFPDNPNAHPVVLSFSQEEEVGTTDKYNIRSGVERMKRYVVPHKRVNFVFLFDGPISYITTSQGISLSRESNGLSIYWPSATEHRKSEQWFYASGNMQKSPLKLRVKHAINTLKSTVKDLVFEPSNSTLANPNYSHIQRIFFQPAYERAFKQTSISGTATPPLYVIIVPVICLLLFLDDLFV
nr:conserved hypothetical protein [Hymenolepis microstoma]